MSITHCSRPMRSRPREATCNTRWLIDVRSLAASPRDVVGQPSSPPAGQAYAIIRNDVRRRRIQTQRSPCRPTKKSVAERLVGATFHISVCDPKFRLECDLYGAFSTKSFAASHLPESFGGGGNPHHLESGSAHVQAKHI